MQGAGVYACAVEIFGIGCRKSIIEMVFLRFVI
jgi:hypothetical protein